LLKCDHEAAARDPNLFGDLQDGQVVGSTSYAGQNAFGWGVRLNVFLKHQVP
jgi:hypothetical protein